jgi:predicted dehydrogenase
MRNAATDTSADAPRSAQRIHAESTSRRTFLTASASALAGTALASHHAFAVDTAPRKLRVGVVGGGFGRQWQWHEHPDSEVVAVSDLIPERRALLSKDYTCAKTYPSLEELVNDPNIDAVAVFTEGPNHVKHVTEVMNHGKHAICAVPACWGSLEEAEQLLALVTKTGLTYMMAETSYYEDYMMTARDLYSRGELGDLTYCESQYLHSGLETLYWIDEHGVNNGNGIGKRTWRYASPPMWYPTHCTAHVTGLTGERLVSVSCYGWGNDSPYLKDNDYGNRHWNETAIFSTDRGNPFRVRVWKHSPTADGVRADWYGTKMSFYGPQENGTGPDIYRMANQMGKDSAGFPVKLAEHETYAQKDWYKTKLLPEPLRHETGHNNSHSFISHEFVDAIAKGRRPTVDVYEALAYTVPGIVAHRSAECGGEQMKIPQFGPSSKPEKTS